MAIKMLESKKEKNKKIGEYLVYLYNWKGDLLSQRNDYYNTLKFYKRALFFSPNDEKTIINIIDCYISLNKCKEANEYYNRYSSMYNSVKGWRGDLCDCYVKNKNIKAAIKLYKEIINRNLGMFNYHSKFANELIFWKRYELAWFEAGVAYMLKGDEQVYGLLTYDLPSLYPEPPDNLKRAKEYVDKIKAKLKSKKEKGKENIRRRGRKNEKN